MYEDADVQSSEINAYGFNRLDFDEIKRVGALVGFDVAACARHKKSCGPGCDWLARDKRYYTLMLLKHIDGLKQDTAATLPQSVLTWYHNAQAAAREYAQMEQRLHPAYKNTAT